MRWWSNRIGSGDRHYWMLSERGQDLVEMALLLPLLLALTFGIIDFGRAFFSYNTIANAAREGARYASIHPTDTTGTTNAAGLLTAGLQCNGGATISPPSQPVTNTVTVKVDCNLQMITGFVPVMFGGSGTIPLSAQATMRVE